MSDLDVNSAREAGVAVPPASPEEYHEGANKLQPGFVATADATEPGRGWTVQMRDAEGRDDVKDGERLAYVSPHDQLPGQVYTPDQLPDPQAAVAAGLPPVRIPEHLVVSDADHIQGPEPSEIAIKDIRDKLRNSAVKYYDDLRTEAKKIEEAIKSRTDANASKGGSKASSSSGSSSKSSSGSSS